MTADTVFYRSLGDLGSEIEIRADGDGRSLTGLLVPYGRPQRINARLTEEFVPGAFRAQVGDPGRVPLFNKHSVHGGSIIGRVTELREQSDGLYGTARVSNTTAGNDALELLRDGVLPGGGAWSIGFREGQNSTRGTVTQRKTATIFELALVDKPAYPEARVLAMRGACPTCGHVAEVEGDGEEHRAESGLVVPMLRQLPLPPLPKLWSEEAS